MRTADLHCGTWATRAARAIGKFYGLALCAAFLGGLFGFVAGLSSACGAILFGEDPEQALIGPFAAGYGMFLGALNGLILSPFFAAGMWRDSGRMGPVIGWTTLAAAAPGVLPFPLSILVSWVLSSTVFVAVSLRFPESDRIPPVPSGRCWICRYDLTGLPADAPCPECGHSRGIPPAYAQLWHSQPSLADQGKDG